MENKQSEEMTPDHDWEAAKNEAKELNGIKRLEWLWTYHKWKVIIPVIVIIIAVYGIRTFMEVNQKKLIGVAMFNATMSSPKDVKFDDDYEAFRKKQGNKQPFDLYTGLVFYDGQKNLSTAAVTSSQKYQGLMSGSHLDITISTKNLIKRYNKGNNYCDLNEFLPDDLKEKWEDGFYYAKNASGQKIPVGIDASSMDCIKRFYKGKDVVIAVSNRSKKKNEVIRFLRWVEKQ